MIRQTLVDAVVPPPERILDLIVVAEEHKKLVWTAGRVLKEAALWKRVRELDYEERKIVLKRVTEFLEDFASQGLLRRRADPQSIGYGNEIGFDYVHAQKVAMQEGSQTVIPTLSRARISRHLSYPIGAEPISESLASVPQFAEIRLLFYSSKYHTPLRSKEYEFLRVEYLNNAKSGEKWPIANLYGRPLQSQWEIAVQPVPRVLRHSVKQYILDSALPQMRHWLVERAPLLQRGSDVLAFFYDEETAECIPRHVANLEPLRKH
jgi:hypothetical protein